MRNRMFVSMFFQLPLTQTKGYIAVVAKLVMLEKWAEVKSVSTLMRGKEALESGDSSNGDAGVYSQEPKLLL
jgi:hypothetical protein